MLKTLREPKALLAASGTGAAKAPSQKRSLVRAGIVDLDRGRSIGVLVQPVAALLFGFDTQTRRRHQLDRLGAVGLGCCALVGEVDGRALEHPCTPIGSHRHGVEEVADTLSLLLGGRGQKPE